MYIIGRNTPQAKLPQSIRTGLILLELLPTAIAATAILTSLVLAQQASRNTDILLAPSSNTSISVYILWLLAPSVLLFTVPIGLLLATCITINKLTEHGEWQAFQSSGVGHTQSAFPFLFAGLVGSAIIAHFSGSTVPESIKQLRMMRDGITIQEVRDQLRPGQFITSIPDYLLRIQSVETQTGTLGRVFLLRRAQNNPNSIQMLCAATGQINSLPDRGLELKLASGVSIDNITASDDNITASDTNTVTSFNTTYISLQPSLQPAKPVLRTTEMGISEIIQAGPLNLQFKLELYKRITQIIAPFVFTLVAFFVCHRQGRRTGGSRYIYVCLLGSVVYYLVVAWGQNIAAAGKGPTWAGSLAAAPLCLATALAAKKITATIFTFVPKRSLPLPATSTHIFKGGNLIRSLVMTEAAKLCCLFLGILTVVTLIFTLLDILPSLTRRHTGPGAVFSYLAYFSPQVLYYLAPFAVFLSAVATVVILANTKQLLIITATGSNWSLIALPMLVLAAAVMLILYWASNSILPITNRVQDYKFRLIKGKSLDESPVTFGYKWTVGEDGQSIYGLRLQSQAPPGKAFTVFAHQPADPANGGREHIFYANEADYDYYYQLHQAVAHLPPEIHSLKGQRSGKPRLPDITAMLQVRTSDPTKMSFAEIREYITQSIKAGTPTTPIKMQLAGKLSLPFSCITLLLLTLPFTFAQSRQGKKVQTYKIGLTLAAGLLFWAAISLFDTFGVKGLIPVWLAALSPHIIFTLLSTMLHHHH